MNLTVAGSRGSRRPLLSQAVYRCASNLIENLRLRMHYHPWTTHHAWTPLKDNVHQERLDGAVSQWP